MGAGYHGGFGGTKGSASSKPADNEGKSTNIPSEQALVAELEKKGIKCTKQDIVFITKDGTGQTVWLEKGNSSAGLEHIEMRHAGDFLSKHGVEKEKIPEHLKTIFQNGKVEYSRVTDRNGGYERLYSSQGRFYLLSGVGENGFIVSAYPIDETDAHRLIRRYKK